MIFKTNRELIAKIYISTSTHINHICDVIEKNVYGAKNNKELVSNREVYKGKIQKRKKVMYYPGREIHSKEPIDNVYIEVEELWKDWVTIELYLYLYNDMDREDWRFKASREVYDKVRDDIKSLFKVDKELDYDKA